jgi:hypothetical protein
MSTLPEIKARITVLEAELLPLRARQNALSGLCRLPHELLVNILLCLQLIEPPHPEHGLTRDDIYDIRWARVMLVCVHVRRVALSAPVLWATFRARVGARWMALCLSRAGQTPLRIHVQAQFRILRRALVPTMHELVDQLWDRCASANLQLPATEFKTMFARPVPLLSHLRVDGLRLQVDLFGGQAPRLRNLVLHHFAGIDGGAPTFPALERLEIQVESMNAELLDRLLALLERTPTLEDLSLVRESLCHPGWNQTGPIDIDDAFFAKRKPLSLPRLRKLFIRDFAAHLILLLWLLPEPSHGLHLHVHPVANLLQWSLNSHPYFVEVLSRVCSFWEHHTSIIGAPLPGGKVQSRNMSVGSPPMNFLEFRSTTTQPNDAGLTFTSPFTIDKYDALLDQIRTIHLYDNETGLAAQDIMGSGLAFMTQLENVIIEWPSSMEYLEILEAWLTAYAILHAPLKHVEIRGCSLAEDQVNDLLKRLNVRAAEYTLLVEDEVLLRLCRGLE